MPAGRVFYKEASVRCSGRDTICCLLTCSSGRTQALFLVCRCNTQRPYSVLECDECMKVWWLCTSV